MKYKIGDKVILKKGAHLYKSSNSLIASSKLKEEKITNITRVVNAKHPYNTTGDLGWMNESDISIYEQIPIDDKKYEIEIELVDVNGLLDYIKEHPNKVIIMDGDKLKEVLGL